MPQYRLLNNVIGWSCFAVALCIYLSTAEPTVSFWDCGEFIASADKLEVGHPPGAPMFMLLARLFAAGAPGVGKAAWMVNAFSALASAFTILFLFWSITHIARRVIVKNNEFTAGETIAVLAAGAIGALAYTFSDTFWFSAVEGEVYAASSFFTAIVFWAMLKWEEAADRPYANRWLILIAYLMGLSIGVHLLNLLAIPAMVLIYYFRKYAPTRKGVVTAVLCSGLVLAGILYGIIPWVVKTAGYFELLFVNGFGFPYNTGVLVYIVVLASLLVFGLRYTYTRKKHVFNTILLSTTVIIIGYSSYSMIVIRSLANPPMDEGSPDNVFALQDYLNREQYGNRPLFYGQYYNAPDTARVEGSPMYTKLNGRYEITYRNVEAKYDPRFMTLFPRMYSPEASHVESYKSWGEVKGRPVKVKTEDGKEKIVYKPTFGENLRFFFSYQLGHMYWRYFMWNFAGRQNDVQADGSIVNGNWLSGIPFMDIPRVGPQDDLPEHFKNDAGRNVYFMLPLLLGIIGLLWQLQRDVKYFWVVMTLFFMTGIAIVVYLNQTPLQPRERDYAYAGSFYAFAMWIGLGTAAVYDLLRRKLPAKAAAIAACVLSLPIPAVMAQQNYHDHDRSGRYTARDVAYNYLNSCAPNAILFTVGDNDTFPLWYLQEVEGVRTDVRVVNLMLLNAEWYISQMKLAVYDSPPLPIALPEEKYLRGRRDGVYMLNQYSDTIPLRQAWDFINSDDKRTKIIPEPGLELDYLPTRNLSIPVDKRKVLSNGTVRQKDADKIEDSLIFRIPSSLITKDQWMVLEIIAANNWERPIYWTSCNHSGTVGLDNYLQQDGIAYRLVPIRTPSDETIMTGRVDSEILYERLMNVFRWDGINDPDVWLDNQHLRTLSIVRARHLYTRLALQLIEEGQKERAVEALDRCAALFPYPHVPPDYFLLLQADALYRAEQTERADKVLTDYADYCMDELHYYYSLPEEFFESVQSKANMDANLLKEITRISDMHGRDRIGAYIEQRLERHE